GVNTAQYSPIRHAEEVNKKVFPMRLAKASIGRKLLFSFSAMALLVLLSALIGVLGFSLVAKTERDVVNNAIPSMIEARQVAELSHQISASVQTLSNAKNEQEHRAA
ncbi:MCP four helix bundle domain-containing protein, partial [Escherichia coli]|uniref:MCP four helix bundle domain-containing protein n=1 Tax=Escherichia coli TaxID=562 RepID=UPI001981E59B